MTILEVQQRILLTDIERPNEPLDVEILELSATVLTVKVANTEVLFRLRKRENMWRVFFGTRKPTGRLTLMPLLGRRETREPQIRQIAPNAKRNRSRYSPASNPFDSKPPYHQH